MEAIRKYRDTMRHTHGWDVALPCARCGHTALPHYEGWEPSLAINFGDQPTIFARVSCASCGQDLREAAGDKLRDMFAKVSVPKANRHAIIWFVVGLVMIVTVPAIGQFIFKPSFQIAWLGAVLCLPLIFAFNYRIGSMRKKCACGRPEYKFMGLLGRSSCYRCRTCGNLLRIRD